MKTKLITFLLATFVSMGVYAQNYYTVRATGYDISDNLDLEAVSYLFGESRDLQDFEDRLNDTKIQISNLDLNNDGFVDYLRVVELQENRVHLVTIQAVLDQNIYQDVATIDVERYNNSSFYVQVVGDPYLYGPNYIIEPVYVRVPFIFTCFLRPNYVVWHSPYYWGYYPSRYKRYHCVPTYRYHKNLYVHVDFRVNTYHYSNVRRNPRAVEIQRQVHRNDYGQRHPDNSFSSRNSGYQNKHEMNRSRSVNNQRTERRSPESTSRGEVRTPVKQQQSRSSSSGTSRGVDSKRTQPTGSQSTGQQQKRTNQQSRVSGGQSQVRKSTTPPAAYQRNNRSQSGTNSTVKQPSQVKRSQSSSRVNNSSSKPSQTRKVESSSQRNAKSSRVSRSSGSSAQSVSRQSSAVKKEQKTNSSKSNTRSVSKSDKSKRK